MLDCSRRKPVQGHGIGLCEAEDLTTWWFIVAAHEFLKAPSICSLHTLFLFWCLVAYVSWPPV
uniref:Uncharacterized protein n=1 Tax=Physcomitrium patens TaxID=3218 RepID=A0A2K1JPE2_PHYPA|nr:hypothetical protein PHYPA_015806 [Physcomitrium patens]